MKSQPPKLLLQPLQTHVQDSALAHMGALAQAVQPREAPLAVLSVIRERAGGLQVKDLNLEEGGAFTVSSADEILSGL